MKNSFYKRLVRILAVSICITAIVHCQKPEDKFPAIPFPSVETTSATANADGELTITFVGEVVEGDSLSSGESIVEYGFVYSDSTVSPVIENSIKVLADPPVNGTLTFTASPNAADFNIARPYAVRAYIIMDRNPEPIYADDTRTLLFTGALAVGMGQLRISNDSVFAGGILNTDLAPVGLISEYGHVITINPQDVLGAPGSRDTLLSQSDHPLPADLTFKTELTVGYNRRYFIKAVVMLENGNTLYSVPAVFDVKGGFNRLADMPDPLASGVVAADLQDNLVYAGLGKNLYTITQNGEDLNWSDPIASPPFINEMRGGSGFVIDGYFYFAFGKGNMGNTKIWKYGESDTTWTILDGVSINPNRESAVAVTIGDIAYIGFGVEEIGVNILGRNSFYTFDAGDTSDLICSECPPAAPVGAYGQTAEVLQDNNGTNRIYMVGGISNGANLTQMIIYTPAQNGQPESWSIETPMPYPVRRNAASFVIGNKMYVGWGNDSENGFFKDLWSYKPGGSFERLNAPFPGVARKHPIAFTFDSVAYIGGGVGLDGEALSDMWRFTPPR